jgi:hypothetical protein
MGYKHDRRPLMRPPKSENRFGLARHVTCTATITTHPDLLLSAEGVQLTANHVKIQTSRSSDVRTLAEGIVLDHQGNPLLKGKGIVASPTTIPFHADHVVALEALKDATHGGDADAGGTSDIHSGALRVGGDEAGNGGDLVVAEHGFLLKGSGFVLSWT